MVIASALTLTPSGLLVALVIGELVVLITISHIARFRLVTGPEIVVIQLLFTTELEYKETLMLALQ